MSDPARPEPGEVTQLLVSWGRGDRSALEQLTPLVYRELRHLAAAHLRRERADHTLQPTALVNEAYLRLIDQSRIQSGSRGQFFAIAANLMRQILVNHARHRQRLKRGGGAKKVELTEGAAVSDKPVVDLLALDAALNELARIDERRSRVVELVFFGGLSEEEAAGILGVSYPTVKRDWRFAKAFLMNHIAGGASAAEHAS